MQRLVRLLWCCGTTGDAFEKMRDDSSSPKNLSALTSSAPMSSPFATTLALMDEKLNMCRISADQVRSLSYRVKHWNEVDDVTSWCVRQILTSVSVSNGRRNSIVLRVGCGNDQRPTAIALPSEQSRYTYVLSDHTKLEGIVEQVSRRLRAMQFDVRFALEDNAANPNTNSNSTIYSLFIDWQAPPVTTAVATTPPPLPSMTASTVIQQDR